MSELIGGNQARDQLPSSLNCNIIVTAVEYKGEADL